MSCIINYLRQTMKGYQPVQTKKADDLYIDEANVWIKSHPADPSIAYKSSDKIGEYVNTLIKDLKKVPILSSNREIVEGHLQSIAIYSYTVRNKLVKKLEGCKGDKTILLNIQNNLAVLVSVLP